MRIRPGCELGCEFPGPTLTFAMLQKPDKFNAAVPALLKE
jgi:hypothetical protein